jgi:hypothetical protein
VYGHGFSGKSWNDGQLTSQVRAFIFFHDAPINRGLLLKITSRLKPTDPGVKMNDNVFESLNAGNGQSILIIVIFDKAHAFVVANNSRSGLGEA